MTDLKLYIDETAGHIWQTLREEGPQTVAQLWKKVKVANVTFPYQTIFSWLPAGYDEVMVDGQIYFRYGNLFFVETPVGYRIVPPPAGIYVSINF